MSTVNRTIETDHDRHMATLLIADRTVPFTLTLTDGKHRTTAQNKLQRLWMNEISQQRGDMTPEEARAYCKLTIGVPLLRSQNEAFRIRYDEVVKPLPYEQKMAIMMEPLDLPVTRLMTTKQKTEYLDGIIRHFAEKGVILTMPLDHQQNSGAPLPEAGAPPPEQPAEEAEPPNSASSNPSQPDPEWLKTVTRMLWGATNVGGNTDANLDLLNNQRKACGAINGTPSQEQRDRASSIYRTCMEVVMSTMDRAVALKIISGVSGVTIDDIHGTNNPTKGEVKP